MTFNNIWFLFLFVPMILFIVTEIYEDKKAQIFPKAISSIKEHN